MWGMAILGIIFLLLYLLRLYSKTRGESESFFFNIGRESLLVYWLHRLLIYIILFKGRSIDNIVNRSFGLAECTMAAIAMILLMIIIAIIWGRIKKYYPESGRKISISVMITGLVFFCI
jgi:fucose 4-O-acetylase-like acetyltransferase